MPEISPTTEDGPAGRRDRTGALPVFAGRCAPLRWMAAGVVLAAAPDLSAGWWADLWRTRDQQAQRAFDAGEYGTAAEGFSDPMRRGVARFRAMEFEAAAGEFGRVAGAEGHFNRGNALVMLGRYDEAAAAYGDALVERPGWKEATENRELALARAAALAPATDDAGGTGGKLEADEIVFDERPRQGGDPETSEEAGAGGELSQKEIEALWMRRLQTKPADFLRAKFAYQLARDEAGESDAGAESSSAPAGREGAP